MKKKRSIGRLALFFLGFTIIASAVISSVVLLHNGAQYFDREAEVIAIRLTSEKISSLGVRTTAALDNLRVLADKVAGISVYEDIDDFGNAQVEKYQLACLQFVRDKKAVFSYGDGVGDFSSPAMQSLLMSHVPACSEVFVDPALGISCVAMYCPVVGSEETDGVIACLPMENLSGSTDELPKQALFCALTDKNGGMMDFYISDSFAQDVSHNTYKYLYNVCENKQQADAIVAAAASTVPQAYPITIGGDDFVAAVVPIDAFGYGCNTICVYSRSDILQGEYSLYDKLIGAVAILTIISVISLLYALLNSRARAKKPVISDDFDQRLGCNTLTRFTQEAALLLDRNRLSRFAVCYMGIKNYAALIAADQSRNEDFIAHHVANVLSKFLTENESFGHDAEDRFVFIIHYMDVNNLADKLKVIAALISNPEPQQGVQLRKLEAQMGVFLTKDGSGDDFLGTLQPDIADAVNNAKIAFLAHAKEYSKPFIVYNSSLGTTYEEDARVEGKMQVALDNREFRLFFQPKYNVSRKSPDSAEVLVRWYDEQTKTYRPPAAFLRVFETNGFIIKIDHYVFRETCLFLRKMKENGQKTIPLSVNISRVTAIDPGFVDFYKRTKDELGIPNGFITLEFAESFVSDSLDTLSRILPELQRCGFRCSVDGFGSSGASLEVLSRFPADEIKVDRQLLLGFGDPKKDSALLSSTYKLVAELGHDLVQEGVETREQLSYVQQLGCGIIQGYYYAKPLYMTDFIDFINDSRLSKVLGA